MLVNISRNPSASEIISQLFLNKELRNRVLTTLGLLLLVRLGIYIPIPGINADKFADFIDRGGQLIGFLDIFTGGAISNTSRTTGVDVAGMLRTFGIDNPFGRKQETEADYLGLIFSSLAGYDIRESVKVWERMKKEHKGQEPPEWMSTHPSSLKRIQNLKNWIPEITYKYPPVKLG